MQPTLATAALSAITFLYLLGVLLIWAMVFSATPRGRKTTGYKILVAFAIISSLAWFLLLVLFILQL